MGPKSTHNVNKLLYFADALCLDLAHLQRYELPESVALNPDVSIFALRNEYSIKHLGRQSLPYLPQDLTASRCRNIWTCGPLALKHRC